MGKKAKRVTTLLETLKKTLKLHLHFLYVLGYRISSSKISPIIIPYLFHLVILYSTLF